MKEKAPINSHLTHKAIISTVDYRQNDGPYSPTQTDARALSLGQATWDEDEISAKVWRHTGDKWSRESEELPLHRVLDLSILLVAALSQEDGKYENHFLDLTVVNKDLLPDLQNYILKLKPGLDERLHELQLLLKKYLKP